MDNHHEYRFNAQDLDVLFYIFTYQSVNHCYPTTETVVQAVDDPAVVACLIAHGYLRPQGALLVPDYERIWQALRSPLRPRAALGGTLRSSPRHIVALFARCLLARN